MTELADAAAAKQAAFAEFQALQPQELCENHTIEEREALRGLLAAANENAVVLEAVKLVLDSTAARLQAILSAVADPGTYQRGGAATRHVMAARINAIA
ncbi:MAG: hypothetical protein JO001_25595 [Alphaproteobacteria bacterium]|nr:hypothetical protein [Alphaproteobacteria bacterium]